MLLVVKTIIRDCYIASFIILSFIFLSNNYFGTPLFRRFLLTHFSLISRIQKIEDNILRGEEELTLHSADGLLMRHNSSLCDMKKPIETSDNLEFGMLGNQSTSRVSDPS